MSGGCAAGGTTCRAPGGTGCRGRELLTEINLLRSHGVILGEQLNHVPAARRIKFTDGLRHQACGRCEQAFGLFGVRTELLANKIGNPLGAGEVQIFFRTEVVGDGSDWPGWQPPRVVAFIPYSPNCASAAAISCFLPASTFLIVMTNYFIAQSILNQMID